MIQWSMISNAVNLGEDKGRVGGNSKSFPATCHIGVKQLSVVDNSL